MVQIEHEVRIADLRFHFRAHPFSRDARVGTTEADGLLTIDGEPFYIEIDESQNGDRKQTETKWRKYGTFDGYVLVVRRTEPRVERLRSWSEAVKGHAPFTTFDRLEQGLPWVDWYGNTVTL